MHPPTVPQITQLFNREYKAKTGVDVRFRMTFGGSGTQARAVIDGLPADLVSLALPSDVMKIVEAGLMDPAWASRFPHNSIVVESVVSIVTRQGNPKGVRGWQDLIRWGLGMRGAEIWSDVLDSCWVRCDKLFAVPDQFWPLCGKYGASKHTKWPKIVHNQTYPPPSI